MLSLGLAFCPFSDASPFDLVKDLNLFARRLTFRGLYSKSRSETNSDESTAAPVPLDSPLSPDYDTLDAQGEAALEQLLLENELYDQGTPDQDPLTSAQSPSGEDADSDDPDRETPENPSDQSTKKFKKKSKKSHLFSRFLFWQHLSKSSLKKSSFPTGGARTQKI